MRNILQRKARRYGLMPHHQALGTVVEEAEMREVVMKNQINDRPMLQENYLILILVTRHLLMMGRAIINFNQNKGMNNHKGHGHDKIKKKNMVKSKQQVGLI